MLQWCFLSELFLLIGAFFKKNWAQLLYDVALFSAVQERKSATDRRSLLDLPPISPSHPSRSPQSISLRSFCYTAGYPQLLFCTWWCIHVSATFLVIPLSPFSTPCPQVHWLHLYLYSSSANNLSILSSRFHIYALICSIFFSFWLTSLYMTDSRSIHISTNDLISSFFMAK